MAAAVNGMVLCDLRAFGATFFVFSDYCRPSMRLAAIMKIPSDLRVHARFDRRRRRRPDASAGRATGGLPGDSEFDRDAARRRQRNVDGLEGDPRAEDAAVAIALTRQNLPTLDRTKYASADGVAKGGYVLADAKGGKPDVILMATGSEVQLAVAAHEELTAAGVASRVVSLPSFELFDEQPQKYRDEVLPPAVTARVGVEAGIRQGWDKYLGSIGGVCRPRYVRRLGPYEEIYKHRGLTAAAVVAKAKEQLGR